MLRRPIESTTPKRTFFALAKLDPVSRDRLVDVTEVVAQRRTLGPADRKHSCGGSLGPRPVDRALDAVLSSLEAIYRSRRYSPPSPSPDWY
jgi:hypothetical protein